MVVRLALAPCTARFTRAIGTLSQLQLSRRSLVGIVSDYVRTARGPPVRLPAEQAPHQAPVAFGDDARAAEPPLLARGLLREQVVQLGVAALQLAGLGHGEAAGGAAVGLHFGHGRGLPCVLRLRASSRGAEGPGCLDVAPGAAAPAGPAGLPGGPRVASWAIRGRSLY